MSSRGRVSRVSTYQIDIYGFTPLYRWLFYQIWLYTFYIFYRGLTQCTQPVEVVSYKIGVCKVSPQGKECKTEFERLSFNGTTSVVLCRPFTGRMHQIRVHLQYLGKIPRINSRRPGVSGFFRLNKPTF